VLKTVLFVFGDFELEVHMRPDWFPISPVVFICSAALLATH